MEDFRFEERNIHFCHSSELSKKEFKIILAKARRECPEHPVFRRTYCSLMREWASHKLFYELGIRKESTLCADLDLDEKWYRKIGYFIIGSVSLIFL